MPCGSQLGHCSWEQRPCPGQTCGLRPTREERTATESPEWEGLGGCLWSCPSAQGCSEQSTQTAFTQTHLWGQENCQLLKSWTVSVPCLLLKERKGCRLNDPGRLSSSSGHPLLCAFWGGGVVVEVMYGGLSSCAFQGPCPTRPSWTLWGQC